MITYVALTLSQSQNQTTLSDSLINVPNCRELKLGQIHNNIVQTHDYKFN